MEKGGSLEKGLSSQEKCDPGYVPRTSGQGERPDPAPSKKIAGKSALGKGFVIK